MDPLSSLKWTCVEQIITKQRLLGTQIFPDNNVGDIVGSGIHKGTLLASSTMGLTLFDLFGEIVTEADLKLFLSKNSIFEDFTPGACIIRSFLLLMKLNGFEISQKSDITVNNTDVISGNIGENIEGEVKEEYEGSIEDVNISVCLEEDTFDSLEDEISTEDPINDTGILTDMGMPIEEITENPEQEIPIGLLTKPTRRSARVRVKSAKRSIENIFDDSENDDSDDESGEYKYERPNDIESWAHKAVNDEAKLDKIIGKVDLESQRGYTKKRSESDDEYQPTPGQNRTLMGLKKGDRMKKKKTEKFLDPETGYGLSDDDDPDKWYWKDGKKHHRRRLKLGIICRGPGCNCKEKFGNKTRQRQHYLDIGCYSCRRPECMIRFPTQGTLSAHRLLKHGRTKLYDKLPEIDPSLMRIVTEKELKVLEEARNMQCRYMDCGMIFSTDKERVEHEKTFSHHKCEYCNAQFVGKAEFTKHRYECLHFVCEVCGKDFRTPEERARYSHKTDILKVVKIHKEQCKNEKGYSCDQCGKAYNVKCALIKHIKRTHEGIKDYCVGYKNGGKQKLSNQVAKRVKTSKYQQNSSLGQRERVQNAPQLEGIVPIMNTPEQQNSGQIINQYNSIMAPLPGYSLGKGINFYQ